MKRTEQNLKKKSFTLIELLIVIGIIAILASLLLPALKKARGQAKKAQCQSNLRQMSMITFSYANDWNGWEIPTTPQSGRTWSDLIAAEYLHIVDWEGAMFDWRSRKNGLNYIIYCPDSQYKEGDYVYSDYGRNHFMGSKRLSSYKRSSRRFYFADSDGGSSDRVYRPSSSDTVSNHFSAYHLGRANLVFLDGHIDDINPANVPPYDLLDTDGYNRYPW